MCEFFLPAAECFLAEVTDSFLLVVDCAFAHRTREAIGLLEKVLEVKESQFGVVHPEVEEEKQRLQQLLKDVGIRARIRKSNTLKELLHMAIEESARR